MREVFSLDANMLTAVAPIYGLVFLFRWKDEAGTDEAKEMLDGEQEPDDLWFANQVVDNACATLAVLNLVLNCPSFDAGPLLRCIKDATAELPSPLKGLAVASSDALRHKHNAFAKKSEMAEADLYMMQQARAAAAKNAKRKRKRKQESTSDEESDLGEEEEDDAFHFIAYLPKAGHLWELDGLKPRPIRHGSISHPDDWFLDVIPVIGERLNRYSAQEIRFNLLAMTEDPMGRLEADRLRPENQFDKVLLESIDAQLAQLKQERDEEADLVARRAHDYHPFLEKYLHILNDKGILTALYSDT
jgi:ubiquitin carboxyl-terminal hydrolase L5